VDPDDCGSNLKDRSARRPWSIPIIDAARSAARILMSANR
jgi:hypothetical protein